MIPLEYVTFDERAARSRYIAARFGSFLAGSVLDVGCDKAVLRGLLPGVEYLGVDVGGTPDMKIDLEGVDRLPFDDGAFACTVCSDVLEHLDNLHHIFGELVRVSRDHLIISLPNNWANARRPIERGRGSFEHYGLPAERPADRHKWFFGLQEAIDFSRAQEARFPVEIEQLLVNEKPRAAPVRMARRLVYPSREKYLNRYAHTLWVVFRKKKAAASLEADSRRSAGQGSAA